jgi:hypothetical protein
LKDFTLPLRHEETAMAELKTKARRASVSAFLAARPDPRARKEAKAIAALMRRLTGSPGKLWGPTIVGFGDVRLRYASGRELDWFLVGFSPRKPALVLYLGLGDGLSTATLKNLGPHKRGKGCLYLKSLEGIDLTVLEGLVRTAIEKTRARGITG